MLQKYYIDNQETNKGKEHTQTQTIIKTEETDKEINNSKDKIMERQTSSKNGQNTLRCVACCKKVGLLGFKCQCGSTFCRNHRMPECHGCMFDFEKAAKERLSRENVAVEAEKVIKF